MSNPIDSLLKAIEHFGGQEQLAKAIGGYQSNISGALNGERKLSVKHAIQIDTLTEGEVTKEQLRPDIFN